MSVVKLAETDDAVVLLDTFLCLIHVAIYSFSLSTVRTNTSDQFCSNTEAPCRIYREWEVARHLENDGVCTELVT